MSNHIHVARRRLLTTRQTARKLDIQENTLARLCERGLITPYDPEPEIPARFSEADVSALRARLLKDEAIKDTGFTEPAPVE